MNTTQEAPDQLRIVLEELSEIELKRDRIAGEVLALEGQLKVRTTRRAQIALEAALRDEEAISWT